MIRILLVDSDAFERDAVRHLLEIQGDMLVIGAFGSGAEAVQCARRERPDLAIVDAALAGENGIAVAHRIHEVAPETHLIVVALRADAAYVQRALLAGVLGSVARDAPGAERLGLLSEREREVLRLTVEGRSIAQTAQKLGLSPKSVETYRSRMMSKLAIEDLPTLVKFAIRHGITTV